MPGKGGFAGNSSRDGLTVGVLYTDEYNSTNGRLLLLGAPIRKANDSAHARITAPNGADGSNERGLEYPKIVSFASPGDVLNDFKSFARENFAKSSNQATLRQFLKDLDENEQISTLYDTLSFVHEVNNLENQYILLKNEISFAPNLKSLLERIDKYAKHFPEPLENKDILMWLRTIVSEALDKWSNIKYQTTIVDLPEHLTEVQNKILILSALENDAKTNAVQRERELFLNEQIELANKSIQTEILPKIETALIEINTQTILLIKELIVRQDKYKEYDQEVQQEVMDSVPDVTEWENATKSFSSLMIPLKVILIKNFRANKKNKFRSTKTETYDYWCVKEGEKLSISNEYELLLQCINDIEGELNQLSNDNISYDMKEIQNKILQSKSALIENIQSNKTENIADVNQIRNDLNNFLIHKKSMLEPSHSLSLLLEYATELLDFYDASINLYEQFMIKPLMHTMYGANSLPSVNGTERKAIVDLEYYNNYVYNQLVWRFKKMEEIVDEIKYNLTKHHYFELDISKFRAQTIIRDVQAFYRQVANESLVNEILYRSFEKFEDSVTALIGVYEKIYLLNKEKSVNNFTGTISKKSPYLSNDLLNDAVLTLKQNMQRNLVLYNYEIAMNTYNQLQFPFANILMSRFKLSSDFRKFDVQKYAQTAIDHINYLKEKIADQNNDNMIIQDIEFNSNNESYIEPFYTWRKNENINGLLKGEEIELNARIEGGPNLSAIKFNEIGIHLKSTDQTKQEQLDETLSKFGIVMSMVGKTYYKCMDKIFSFAADESIVINYSFKRNRNGEPLMTNKVYQKLKKIDYILSPYTTWRIKFIGSTENFEKLKEFEKIDMNIELSGRGQYIQNESINSGICDRELNYSLL